MRSLPEGSKVAAPSGFQKKLYRKRNDFFWGGLEGGGGRR